MEELTTLMRGKAEAKRYGDLAKKCKESFNKKFYNKRSYSCIYNLLKEEGLIKPNK